MVLLLSRTDGPALVEEKASPRMDRSWSWSVDFPMTIGWVPILHSRGHRLPIMEPWMIVAIIVLVVLVLLVGRRHSMAQQAEMARDPGGPVTFQEGRRQDGRMTIFTFDGQRPDAWIDVVGESNYQENIGMYAGGRTTDGAAIDHHKALLLPEPTNRYDENAVVVCLVRPSDGATLRVGYLSRDDAIAYAPVIDRASPYTISTNAVITGGWDRGGGDRGSFGVRLNLGSPADLWTEMDSTMEPMPMPRGLEDPRATVPVAADWNGDCAGKSVCFTGESGFRFQGKPVTRAMQELLATQHGLTVLPRVTKKLDILIIGHDRQLTGKAAKAAEYGTLIVDEADFWSRLGVSFDR